MKISNAVKTLRVKVDGTNYTAAAGSTAVTSEAIDTFGFDGIRIVMGFGAIVSGAATSFKLQECATSGGSYADIAGSSVTVADTDDNKIAIAEIYQPRARFIKVVISRATQNATVDFMIAELTSARVLLLMTIAMGR